MKTRNGSRFFKSIAPRREVWLLATLACLPATLPAQNADRPVGIAIGHLAQDDAPRKNLPDLQTLTLRVTETGSKKELPARVDIEASDGTPARVYSAGSDHVAVRDGLVYLNGEAKLKLRAGKYRVAATRGMEWSRDEQPVDLTSGPAELKLQLRHEVDTTGFIAADTDIQTRTSGHGDGTVRERLLGIAGEGVELAVATDQDHITDFRPEQENLGLTNYFTPVVGADFVTPNGQFTGFPLKAGDQVPVSTETNWSKVVESIRAKGAGVVILDQPRAPSIDESPFSKVGLNRSTGDRTTEMPFTFDALELVTSSAAMSDPFYLFVDWFALLNAGEKISAVAASGSQTLSDPVGLGRTYIPSATDNPAALNVDELCDHLLKGRATISLGIFCSVTVDGKYVPGDLVPVKNGAVKVSLRIAAPDWVQPRKAMLFVNGQQKAAQDVPAEPGRPTDTTLTFDVPATGVDAHLVCVVLGDPVKFAGWKSVGDYTLAATNPVFLDVNHDGRYNNPRESAARILASIGGDIDALINTLEVVPPPVGVEILALAHDRQTGVNLVRLNRALKRLAELQPYFDLYKINYNATHQGASIK